MADWRNTSHTDLAPSEPAGTGSGTRILRGADRFRTPIAGTRSVGSTSRVRRSVTGSSTKPSELPPTVEPLQVTCTHCGVAFIAAIRPGLTQAVPCIHCGHANAVAGSDTDHV